MAEGSSRQQQSTYHSPLRARQAAETRKTVLGAATRLFTERGWAGTTLAAVAAEAGTAVETVYAAFGSKSGLLIAAIDVAIVGDDNRGTTDRAARIPGLGVGERSERLALAARIITRALEQAVPLMGSLREASASDAAASTRLHTYETDRRAVIAAGLELIKGNKATRGPGRLDVGACQPGGLHEADQGMRMALGKLEGWLIETASKLIESVTSSTPIAVVELIHVR